MREIRSMSSAPRHREVTPGPVPPCMTMLDSIQRLSDNSRLDENVDTALRTGISYLDAHLVLSLFGGDDAMATARNPSAVIMAEIRKRNIPKLDDPAFRVYDAVCKNPTAFTSYSTASVVQLLVLIDDFVSDYKLDSSAEKELKGALSAAEILPLITTLLTKGDLRSARNVSSVVMSECKRRRSSGSDTRVRDKRSRSPSRSRSRSRSRSPRTLRRIDDEYQRSRTDLKPAFDRSRQAVRASESFHGAEDWHLWTKTMPFEGLKDAVGRWLQQPGSTLFTRAMALDRAPYQVVLDAIAPKSSAPPTASQFDMTIQDLCDAWRNQGATVGSMPSISDISGRVSCFIQALGLGPRVVMLLVSGIHARCLIDVLYDAHPEVSFRHLCMQPSAADRENYLLSVLSKYTVSPNYAQGTPQPGLSMMVNPEGIQVPTHAQSIIHGQMMAQPGLMTYGMPYNQPVQFASYATQPLQSVQPMPAYNPLAIYQRGTQLITSNRPVGDVKPADSTQSKGPGPSQNPNPIQGVVYPHGLLQSRT